MNLRSLNQPLTLKGALKVLSALGLAVVLVLGVWGLAGWITSGPSSPGKAKRALWKYLKAKTHQRNFRAEFDLDLKQKVTDLETNAVKLRLLLANLQTNTIADLRTDVSKMRQELAALKEQNRSLKNQVQNQTSDAADKQRRLNAAQYELGHSQTNVVRYETNLLAARENLAGSQARLVQLTNALNEFQTNLVELQGEAALLRTNLAEQISASQTNLVRLQKEIAAARKSISEKQQELASVRSKVKEQANDLQQKETRFDALKATVAKAQTILVNANSNLLASQNFLETKRAAQEAKQKEIEGKEAALLARQKELAARQTEHEDKSKELTVLRRELERKQQLLARQHNIFAQEVRKKINQAQNYESIYQLIGQQLWLADQFLGGQQPERQREALRLAVEASQQATQSAENDWLAARICEAYIWPNLDLKSQQGIRLNDPEYLLQVCGGAFQRAKETENVIHNYQLSLNYITNSLRAEVVNYQLGSIYEREGKFDEAMECYRKVQENTNYMKYAEQRLEAVKQKRKQSQALR